MPNIDVPIPLDLKKVFDIPPCDSIKLPNVKPLKITLPTGGSISAISDLSKGIPTDCSMTFSLMLQVAPLLASMECLLRVLKLVKPLIAVIQGLPAPPVKAIQEFGEAAGDLVDCLLVPTPANLKPFLRDLLCLIIKALKCVHGQLKTIVGVMSGLQLQLQAANASGNDELAGMIQCAQKNAETEAGQVMASVEPIGVILDLAGAFFGLAGREPISLPKLGSQSDLEGLNTALQSIQTVIATLQIAADVLGGCD